MVPLPRQPQLILPQPWDLSDLRPPSSCPTQGLHMGLFPLKCSWLQSLVWFLGLRLSSAPPPQALVYRLLRTEYRDQKPHGPRPGGDSYPGMAWKLTKGRSSKSRLSSTLKDFVSASAHVDLALLFTVLGARPHNVQLLVLWPSRLPALRQELVSFAWWTLHVLFGFKNY